MANQLRKIREMRGLSMDQLAQRVGASRSKLYKLENGSQRLTDVWIARLADALAVAPGDFLATGGPSIPVSHYISSAFSELAGFDIPPPLEQLSPPRRLSRAEDCMACEVYDDSCDGIYPKGSLVILRRPEKLQSPMRPGDRIVVRHFVESNDDGRIMEILLGYLDRTITGDLVLLTRSSNRQLLGAITIRRPDHATVGLQDARRGFAHEGDVSIPDFQAQPGDQAEIMGVVAMVIQPETAA
jgi:transcriptional regulator with XRE-family HTH domain